MAPRIGISMTPETIDGRDVEALDRVYAAAVLGAGGVPLLLPAMGADQLDDVLDVLDGLLLSGGGDVAPAHYGAEWVPEVAGVSEARDHWELLLAQAALRRGLPTLGICRGAQLLDVAAGGTLEQHLPHRTELAHRVAERPAEAVHDVVVDTTSLLAGVLGTVELGVNSLHHQAIEVVGEGLRPVAWAPDGTIEAVEGTGEARVLAVQWHPELLVGTEAHAALFRWLVEEAGRTGRDGGRRGDLRRGDLRRGGFQPGDARPGRRRRVGGRVSPGEAPPSRPAGYDELNRYSTIIVDEALRRGIAVEVTDVARAELRLSLGGRSVTTRESLSELTSALAFLRCDHKVATREVLGRAGLALPAGRPASFDAADLDFLAEHGDIVVKPARGEQGRGVTVGVTGPEALAEAQAAARAFCPDVLLEERCDGDDLRILVIGEEVVAASVRRPAHVVGDGRSTVAALVEAASEARAAATGGASTIPLDATTSAVVTAEGHGLGDVLADGQVLVVRRTANLHTGGTIHDVTDELHPALAAVAVQAARALAIPVLGLDLVVPAVDGPGYRVIEANEQPGLANHEPRPTVQRFVDLLFPETA
jgi:gamma-glutamyl-gamma-aminobutyrate hydrolase PuuD/D-alanine-D-alanine ligase-like ATP-grasp enzyme